MKEEDKKKVQKKAFNGMEISNLPDKEFKIKVTKILTELRRRIDEHSENSTKRYKR